MPNENPADQEQSIKEQRINSIKSLYYSKPEVQRAIFDFSSNREVVPRYFEGFGKLPDSLQYPGDIFPMVQRGATSFHCSIELWQDSLSLSTGQTREQLNNLRIGWDFLIDIDSKYLDYSKISAELIVNFLKFHGIKNIGVKFSGSKGMHIIIPWKAFPKEINEIQTSNMFPEWPRIICQYIIEKTKPQLIEKITKLTIGSKYVKDFSASEKVMPDIILVSSRHLFRMPYSLHEKTALASIVIDENKISEFQIQDANPLKITKDNIKSFTPNSKENEASELLLQALDWHKEQNLNVEVTDSVKDFKPIKLDKISDEFFPPSIKEILKGMKDGRKRALFILINLFRSIGMDKDELEKRLYSWNEKNEVQLKQGYIKSQLSWSYRNKVVPPPNFNKDYYKGIGIVPTEEELRYKNPVNYVVKKTLGSSQNSVTKSKPKTKQ